MMDLYEYTNAEVEEMGLPAPCPCLATYREATDSGEVYEVCADCGAARRTGKRVAAWS